MVLLFWVYNLHKLFVGEDSKEKKLTVFEL